MVRCLRIKKLKKGEFYYKQGEHFDEVGFVLKGLLYNYYTNQDGEIFVKTFISEGQPVTCYSNLMTATPASFSAQTLEPTVLITLKYMDLQSLYSRHVCWERMGRISAEKLFIEKEKREFEFLSMDAKARYMSFVQRMPNLLNRIPQYLIASYIGVSAVSLSRLRSGDSSMSHG